MSSLQDRWPISVGKLKSKLFRSPKSQVAALCYRFRKNKPEVLLITSRDTGRWVMPKGWPMKGLDDSDAALQEAWEEAGVRKARINRRPLGIYRYIKRQKRAPDDAVETTVYAAEVTQIKDKFPEASQRKRKWVSPQKAAKMVDEPDLAQILETAPSDWINARGKTA